MKPLDIDAQTAFRDLMRLTRERIAPAAALQMVVNYVVLALRAEPSGEEVL